MSDTYCTDCKRNTEVVFDHAAGDTVCSECGLVLESRSIDESSEWRTFADDSGAHDPNRSVGQLTPSWLTLLFLLLFLGVLMGPMWIHLWPACRIEVGIQTGLLSWPSRLFLAWPIGWYLSVRTPMEIKIGALKRSCSWEDRASELYKRLEDQKCTRGRNLEALVAGCIYIACRQEGKPRTVKEICSMVAGGATKKEIGRAKEFIVKQLKVEMGESMEMGTIHAGDYLRRFCSNLGMSNEEVKAVQETVQKSGDYDIRRSPISVAAAIIFMITQLSDSKKPLRDISIATTVAEGTIKNSYRDLYPHAAKIIPDWYAKERDVKNLSIPKA